MLDQHISTKRLRDLLPEAQFFPNACDPFAAKVSSDPRAVSQGSLYVHLDECDASDAELAAQHGASAVVAERLLPGISTPQAIVDDARIAQRLLEDALQESLEDSTPLIAVGGSMGRSTVAGLLASIYAEAGAPTGVYGRTGSDDGETYMPHDRKVAPAKRWRGWFDRCHLGEVAAAITAVAPGRYAPWQDLHAGASIVCLTSLRGDRLDSRGRVRWTSVAEHRAAMRRALGPLTKETTLIVNGDDADAVAYASSSSSALITYGEGTHLDVVATPLEEYPGGQEFMVHVGRHTACLVAPRSGAAYRYHCLAAIATALAAGFDLQTAVRGVESALGPLGFVEPVVCGQAFPTYLDRAMRPLALRAALAAALPNGGGRTLLALRLAEDPTIAYEQLAVAESMADRVIASGSAADSASKNTTSVPDRLSAIALAIGLADEGDAVLVAGCKDPSSDHGLVEKLIHRRQACEETNRAA